MRTNKIYGDVFLCNKLAHVFLRVELIPRSQFSLLESRATMEWACVLSVVFGCGSTCIVVL